MNKKVITGLGISILSAAILSETVAFANTSTNTQKMVVPAISTQLDPNNPFSKAPKGFDPLTATDSQLKQYGFPERPNSPEELQAWTKAMQHAKIFLKPVYTKLNRSFTTSSTENNWSTNWAGYTDTMNFSYSDPLFSDIHSHWTVPNIQQGSTQSYNPSDAAAWIGIGGFTSNKLLQIGTDSIYDGSFQYTTWIEDENFQNSAFSLGLPISPGDVIYADMTYSNGAFNYWMEDVNTYTVVQGTFAPYGTPINTTNDYDGTSADWILERASTWQADYSAVTFSASGTNSVTYGGQTINSNPYTITVHQESTFDGTSTSPSYSNASSSTTPSQFTVYFHNY